VKERISESEEHEFLSEEHVPKPPRGARRWLIVGAGLLAAAAAVAFGVIVIADGEESATPLVYKADSGVLDVTLTAGPATLELDDRSVETWAFNGQVPGPELRLEAGDRVRATVRNDLPQPLTIHWHGIALANEMDGVPDVTQDAIAPGEEFVYEFTAPDPGTYFYHPHTGTQLDTGLYAPLIVEDSAEADTYDRELTVMLDDWIDGTGETPDQIFDRLEGGGMPGMSHGTNGMSGMDHQMGGTSGMDDMSGMSHGMPGMGGTEGMDADESPLGGDTGDVQYPAYLVNGRAPSDPAVFDVEPGDLVRLRLINAGSDTPFRVAVGGQVLNVIAADGFPVRPVAGDSILLGMGERYDVVVEIDERGSFPLVAEAEGKDGRALAVISTGAADVSPVEVRLSELAERPLTQEDLRATPAATLASARPDRAHELALTGGMAGYNWALESGAAELAVREGERVRLALTNETRMWHPMHLHGHTFQVIGPNGDLGARKDTVIVPAGEWVVVEFDADNPGTWALHCHNIYHAEAGMTALLRYEE
jgi:FtsP/CotA-like multicopper oxidase with cupredoxin domain